MTRVIWWLECFVEDEARSSPLLLQSSDSVPLASLPDRTAAGGSDGRSVAADPSPIFEELGDEELPQIEPFTPPRVAANAPRLGSLRVGNGQTRFAGDGTLLTTISPNGDGFRDRAIVRFSLDQTATVQISAFRTGSGLKQKVWGTEQRFTRRPASPDLASHPVRPASDLSSPPDRHRPIRLSNLWLESALLHRLSARPRRPRAGC